MVSLRYLTADGVVGEEAIARRVEDLQVDGMIPTTIDTLPE